MDRGGLGEGVFDQRVEALAAPSEEDWLGHLPGTEVGDESAASGDRIDTLGYEAPHIGERNPRGRAGLGLHLGYAARGAERGESCGQKPAPVHRARPAGTWIIGS
jgi:hypothetical protein